MRAVAPAKRQGTILGAGMVVAGKYRLDSAVGKGGMGEVWIATNLVLDSKIALKVLLRSLLDNPEAGERLLREARAAARISHRNIVQVYDFGYVETGEPFIVMELLRGESLAERLERVVRLPAIQAVETLVPVAHALGTAHAKGIIHRDLKPGNVFLSIDESNTETPKVVDFGIAKMADVKHQSRVTLDGSVLGSPEYLSPEQAIGASDIDARADVWALAVTLYETVTGRVPFDDPNYNKLLHMIVEDEPVPTTELGAGDAELWQIIKKGLQKRREDRWQSVFGMGSALEEWLRSYGVFTNSGSFARATDPGTGPISDRGFAPPSSGSGPHSARVTGPNSSRGAPPASTGHSSVPTQLSANDLVASEEQRAPRKSRALWLTAAAALCVGVIAAVVFFQLRSKSAGAPLPVAAASTAQEQAAPMPSATASSPVPAVSTAAAPEPSSSSPHDHNASTATAKAAPGAYKPPAVKPTKASPKADDIYGSRR